MYFILLIQRKEFLTNFLEGRTPYDELALIFEVPTSYIGREVSWLDIAFAGSSFASPHVELMAYL